MLVRIPFETSNSAARTLADAAAPPLRVRCSSYVGSRTASRRRILADIGTPLSSTMAELPPLSIGKPSHSAAKAYDDKVGADDGYT